MITQKESGQVALKSIKKEGKTGKKPILSISQNSDAVRYGV